MTRWEKEEEEKQRIFTFFPRRWSGLCFVTANDDEAPEFASSLPRLQVINHNTITPSSDWSCPRFALSRWIGSHCTAIFAAHSQNGSEQKQGFVQRFDEAQYDLSQRLSKHVRQIAGAPVEIAQRTAMDNRVKAWRKILWEL